MKTKLYLTLFFIGGLLTASAQNSQDRIEAASGKVIGMTSSGGNHGAGLAYQYNLQTNQDSLIDLVAGGQIGFGLPYGDLLQVSNGLMYGTVTGGGIYNDGGIFRFNSVTVKDSLLFSFDSVLGYSPNGYLIQASNGLLYGTTEYGGSHNQGVMFSFDPATYKYTVLINFDSVNGASPVGGMMQASNGLLYGTTAYGGDSGTGVLFSYNISTGKDSVIFSFTGTLNGSNPYGTLMQGADGLLYGTTYTGGYIGYGTLFRVDPVTEKDSILINFDNITNGANPSSRRLLQAPSGLIYGTTYDGGPLGYGLLYSFDLVSGKDSILYQFTGTSDGANPLSVLALASNSKLYGFTQAGAANNLGNIFSFSLVTGQYLDLLDLINNNDGSSPSGGFIQASNGMLYAMMGSGGVYDAGIIFNLSPAINQVKPLINFQSANTWTPQGGFTMASNGILYGMRPYDGAFNSGDIFSMDQKTGQTNILYQFDSSGVYPYGTLIQANNGLLYGMTYSGGLNQLGTVFAFDPSTNKDTTILNFNSTNGAYPEGDLMQASNGLLYGMTLKGGAHNLGCIFSLDLVNGNNNTLFSFDTLDGEFPFGTLTQVPNGMLYGMTYDGGTKGDGAIFSFNPTTNHETVLVNFNYTNGANPYGNLVRMPNGLLYGMTNAGGSSGKGTLFAFNPVSGIESVLLDLNGPNGAAPLGSLVADTTANILYGTASQGGSSNYGTLFTFNPNSWQQNTLLDFNFTNGAYPDNVLVVKSSGTLGIQQLQASKDIALIYPNPFTTVAHVIFEETGTHYLEIDDITGKQLKWISCTDTQYAISRDGLSAGMYIFKIYDAQKKVVASTKIIAE